MTRKRVIIESPYAGDVERNERYARACLADSLKRGEAPIAFHLLYTQDGVLDDTKPEERAAGIAASQFWYHSAELVAIYRDLGMSNGMLVGMDYAEQLRLPTEFRLLPLWVNGEPDWRITCHKCKHTRTAADQMVCQMCRHFVSPKCCTYVEVARGR